MELLSLLLFFFLFIDDDGKDDPSIVDIPTTPKHKRSVEIEHLSFDEFKEKYNKSYTDPAEEAAAKEEFEKHEAQVEQHNAEYEAGNSNYKEEVEPWDDETLEQFEKEKTGLISTDNNTRIVTVELKGRGLIMTPEHERINTPEEIAYFDQIYAKYDRQTIPSSWDSRDYGKVYLEMF